VILQVHEIVFHRHEFAGMDSEMIHTRLEPPRPLPVRIELDHHLRVVSTWVLRRRASSADPCR
jgi:hypothetical protein